MIPGKKIRLRAGLQAGAWVRIEGFMDPGERRREGATKDGWETHGKLLARDINSWRFEVGGCPPG